MNDLSLIHIYAVHAGGNTQQILGTHAAVSIAVAFEGVTLSLIHIWHRRSVCLAGRNDFSLLVLEP